MNDFEALRAIAHLLTSQISVGAASCSLNDHARYGMGRAVGVIVVVLLAAHTVRHV
jgi:hypothetical protein